jgi:phosphoglycolate phosphatase-like HAD superfamily hydrolase
MSLKVVIYDCDGVLFDSKKANEAFYNHILKHFGMPPLNENQLDFVHVSTSRGAIDYLFQNTPWKEEAKAYLQVIDNTPFIPLLRLELNVRTILEHLRPIYYTAIATNRGLSMSLIMKEHGLTGLFDMIVTCRDVQKPKPDPECLIKILQYFDIDPNGALYIGDSEVDRLVSEGAKVPFASYKNPNLKSSYYFNDHLDLLKVLSQ